MLGESCISTARGRDTRWTPCGGTRRHRFAWWSVTRWWRRNTPYFRSVVVFGQVRFVEEEREKLAALELLAEKYAPGEREQRQREIAQGFDHLYVLELDVECMTGKEAVELLRQRKGGG